MRSLFEQGKTHDAFKEMNKVILEISGIREMRWADCDKTLIMDRTIYHFGNDTRDYIYRVGTIISTTI